MKRVEVLYSSGCPSYVPALERVRAVLREEGLDLGVSLVRIDTEAEAQERQFPGSPTIRLDGRDIEGEMAPPVGLTCRTYRGPDGAFSPVPFKDAIRDAVRGGRNDAVQAP